MSLTHNGFIEIKSRSLMKCFYSRKELSYFLHAFKEKKKATGIYFVLK